MKKIKYHVAALQDAKDILKIYKTYVENTAITFEYEVPSIMEMETRIQNTLVEYP